MMWWLEKKRYEIKWQIKIRHIPQEKLNRAFGGEYEPPFINAAGEFVEEQIVSRKYTQLREVELLTALGYLTEAMMFLCQYTDPKRDKRN